MSKLLKKNQERDMEEPLPDSEYTVVVGPQAEPREYTVEYLEVLVLAFWHLGGLYGLYLCLFYAKWATIFFSVKSMCHSIAILLWVMPPLYLCPDVFLYVCAMLGITAGAHRLWSHRSYKARLPLQILLMLFQSLAYQHTVLRFAKEHRAHHKYSDTDADPYNPARGFFFAHIGWLMVRQHPEAVRRGRAIDVSDLYQNPVLLFQSKYSFYITGLLAFVLPTLIPYYYWHETLINAYHISLFRLIAVWNAFFTTNSAAHMYGTRPYDRRIMPSQSLPVTLITLGEGFHNFHHVFPFDYRAAELGNNSMNLTTKFIDFFAWIGLAYDLKHASDDLIARRAARTGDGTDLWGRVKDRDGEPSNSTRSNVLEENAQ